MTSFKSLQFNRWYDENANPRCPKDVVIEAGSETSIAKKYGWLPSVYLINSVLEEQSTGTPKNFFSNSIPGEGISGNVHDHIIMRNYTWAPNSLKPFIKKGIEWITRNLPLITATNMPFASKSLGYGGCVDLLGKDSVGRAVLIDVNTEYTTQATLRTAISSERSLAACSHGLGIKDPRLITMTISTSEPHAEPLICEWNNSQDALKTFLYAFEVWCSLEGYDPRLAIE